MKKLILTVALLGLPTLSHAAVFTDNFDGDAIALNQTSFIGGWTVSAGTVDLIDNPGYFDLPPDPGNTHGKYIDLDGSTGDAGLFRKQLALASATQYVLSFDLAGSHRNQSPMDTVKVNFGTTSQSYTLASSSSFANYTLFFTTSIAGNYLLDFENLGASDNRGALLDNVSVTAVPEPETYMMMLGGLGLIGFAARRRKA